MGIFDTDDYEVVPEGNYAAKLEDCSLDETKADPKISVTYKLNNGRTMWQNFTFKDTTVKWLAWQLGVIGAWQLAKKSCTDDENYAAVARACLDALGPSIGKYFEAEVAHREYNGKTYADLKLVNEIPAAIAKAYPKTSAAQNQSQKAPPPVTPKKMDNDEEIPF